MLKGFHFRLVTFFALQGLPPLGPISRINHRVENPPVRERFVQEKLTIYHHEQIGLCDQVAQLRMREIRLMLKETSQLCLENTKNH